MRVMIAAKEGTEILVDILNQSFSAGRIREICGQDKFAMPNGYTDFSRYAGLHKNEPIGEGRYKDMTYGDFLLKLGSFTGRGGYLDKLIRNSMKPFMEGDDPGKRQGLFNRLYPGLMKYFRKDFGNLFRDFDLNNPSMNTHYTTMLSDVASVMDAIFGNHGRYLRDMNSAVNRFVAGNLDLERLRTELNSINDRMFESGESNGTAVEKASGEAWNRLESSCRMSVPGVDPKHTWYKVSNHEDLWPVATEPMTGWCVSQKGNSGRHFFYEVYRPPYYMLCEGHRPVALLHVRSHQFKDRIDIPIELDRPSHVVLVESGMRLLEKLNYSGDYREDFETFEEYLEGGAHELNDETDPRYGGVLNEVMSLSDDEFKRRLRDSAFMKKLRDAVDDMGMHSFFPAFGESKLELLIGRDAELDRMLIGNPLTDDDTILRILSAEEKKGRDLLAFFRAIVYNHDQNSCILSVMERYLCPELVKLVGVSHEFNKAGAEEAARILLEGEGRLGRGNLLSALSRWEDRNVIGHVLEMSEDSGILDAAASSPESIGFLRSEGISDGILWNIVRNGGEKSLGRLMNSCPEKLSGEMADHVVRHHAKDIGLIESLIRHVPLERAAVESIVGLGSKELDKELLFNQELDDDLALMAIDELGDEYQGQLGIRRYGSHEYGPEVVDAAVEHGLRNEYGLVRKVIETQRLSDGNLRAVAKWGERDDKIKAIEKHRLPEDLIEELLSSGRYDSPLASHQPLDDGQMDEIVGRQGKTAIAWIASNDLAVSGHAYDLILDGLGGLGSEDVMGSLLKRKSLDWKRLLPAVLEMPEGRSNSRYGELLKKAAKECGGDDELLSVAGALDRSDVGRERNEIIRAIMKRKPGRRLADGLLHGHLGESFAYLMADDAGNLDQSQLHYIAERFEGAALKIVTGSGKDRLDDETVELLRRWNNGEINFQLLKHGYLDKDMDADEVGELAGGYVGRGFSSNLFQVRGLGDGFIEYAEKHPSIEYVKDLCGNPFLSRKQVNRLLSLYPNDDELKSLIAMNNENGDVIRMFNGSRDSELMSDLMENGNADETVMREVCSSYRGRMTRSMTDMMYDRFGMIPPVERSGFLFNLIRKNSSDFDEDELVRLHGIGDGDVKWLCRKICMDIFGKALPVSESRTARIAGRICRRIVRMNCIAERISR